MPAGRPKKPVAVKVLEGTYRPDRATANEPQPDILAQVPDPPKGMGKWGVQEWLTVCHWLQGIGALASTDLSLIAAYCNEIDQYWEFDKKLKKEGAVLKFYNPAGDLYKVQAHPYAGLRKASLDNALKLAGQFGFTPAARARLTMGSAGTDKPKSKMAHLMAGK
jgi:P27 family predicted phage terminase small subunit